LLSTDGANRWKREPVRTWNVPASTTIFAPEEGSLLM
jgi:hypothetical protein